MEHLGRCWSPEGASMCCRSRHVLFTQQILAGAGWQLWGGHLLALHALALLLDKLGVVGAIRVACYAVLLEHPVQHQELRRMRQANSTSTPELRTSELEDSQLRPCRSSERQSPSKCCSSEHQLQGSVYGRAPVLHLSA